MANKYADGVVLHLVRTAYGNYIARLDGGATDLSNFDVKFCGSGLREYFNLRGRKQVDLVLTREKPRGVKLSDLYIGRFLSYGLRLSMADAPREWEEHVNLFSYTDANLRRAVGRGQFYIYALV